MKKTFFLFLLGQFCLVSFLHAANIKVLFIGNSYVGTNNLPQVYYQLALSAGDTVTLDANNPGGFTLNGHSTNATTLSKINAQPWDFVVLQEQSQMPSFPPAQVANDVYPYARLLDSLITENYACSKTLFFMTWGRKYGDAGNCANYPPLCTYAGMQQRLRESYLEMTENNLAMVAPVGAAFARSISLDSTLNLYSPDNSHPSMAGTYLAACVFYASTFQSSPVGLSYTAGLSPAVSSFLQQVATDVVLDSLSTWHLNPVQPQSSFTYSQNGFDVSFNNTSLNGRNYEWNFGDGNTSTLKHPIHTYSVPGVYNVQLISSLRCLPDTIGQSVTITPSGMLAAKDAGKLEILSGTNGLTLKNTGEAIVSFKILDLLGREIFSGQLVQDEIKVFNAPFSGMTLLQWQSNQIFGANKIWLH
jgi:hypothetical protein